MLNARSNFFIFYNPNPTQISKICTGEARLGCPKTGFQMENSLLDYLKRRCPRPNHSNLGTNSLVNPTNTTNPTNLFFVFWPSSISINHHCRYRHHSHPHCHHHLHFIYLYHGTPEGLLNVNEERRAGYVVDPDGFIGWKQDAKNRMYTAKSLLKDFRPIREDDKPGNYFIEHILVPMKRLQR